jgi:hypothetical protein
MECQHPQLPAKNKWKPAPDVEKWIEALVSEAPPLSDWQRRVITGAFHGTLPTNTTVR